jgi:hypothetical protein
MREAAGAENLVRAANELPDASVAQRSGQTANGRRRDATRTSMQTSERKQAAKEVAQRPEKLGLGFK